MSFPKEIYKHIPTQITDIISYFFDKYKELSDDQCIDHKNLAMENWLGCDIHNTSVFNCSFAIYNKNLLAFAFSKMFGNGYELFNYLDSYEFKDRVKNSNEFKIQNESISIGIDEFLTLPVFGTFFVKDKLGNNLIVKIDFGYSYNSCGITIMSNPSSAYLSEKFAIDLRRSMTENDIYFKKCLEFCENSVGFIKVRETSWDDLVLKPDTIKEIRDNTIGVIDNIDKLCSIGVVPNRNVILISPPGMAKTTVFRAISCELQDITRIWCTGKSISMSSHVSLLFQAARSMAPCVLFIEDMDLFGRDRSSPLTDGGILNEFLACLDGISLNSGVIVMASTNDISSMDEALVNRPGRFDVKIEIPYPDSIDRGQMILKFLSSVNAKPDGSVTKQSIKTIVELTDGLTGAYIKELVNATIIRAMSNGKYVSTDTGNFVLFSIDDLNAAAEQIVRNYKIGIQSRKYLRAELELK